MGAHDGHRGRMIRRFLENGLDGFQPHEILEVLLFFSVPRVNTNEVAHNLINIFGSLAAVFDAPFDELLKIKGVGRTSAVLLKLIPATSRAYVSDLMDTKRDVIIRSPADGARVLRARYIGRTVETVFLLCMDSKGKMVSCTLLHEGSVNSAEVNVRKIAELVLRHNASSVILAHSHPGGAALPSEDDLLTTKRIADFLGSIGVQLADHLIFDDTDYVSLADSGFLNKTVY